MGAKGMPALSVGGLHSYFGGTEGNPSWRGVMQYREEQRINQEMILAYLVRHGKAEKKRLEELCRDYLQFRDATHRFHTRYFQATCTAACFQQDRSACCNKDGIITFFADLVINALVSSPKQMAALLACLGQSRNDMKCIYLGSAGCRWRIKPLVCEMFICDRAKQEVFESTTGSLEAWCLLEKRAATYRWPDRQVLFDEIESRFMAAGVSSSLMYLHNSPGLLRVKKKAGLI